MNSIDCQLKFSGISIVRMNQFAVHWLRNFIVFLEFTRD